MFEESNSVSEGSGEGMSMVTKILLAVVVVFIAVSAFFFYELNDKISALQAQQTASEQQEQKKISELSSQIKADREMLASQVGMTEKELAARSAQLRRQEEEAESRLAEQQNAVNTAVTGVKTEVTTVEGDLSSTKSDLEATKAKLEHTIGDLGLQSGLIAHTRDELDTLKHRGDRNYYEFTLRKGKGRTPVSTISLELRKTDPKRSKYTLDVLADDRTIEKKDRNVFEPLQFYTGRDHMLYELVVNDIQKDQISGYLSTPKNAPQPAVQ